MNCLFEKTKINKKRGREWPILKNISSMHSIGIEPQSSDKVKKIITTTNVLYKNLLEYCVKLKSKSLTLKRRWKRHLSTTFLCATKFWVKVQLYVDFLVLGKIWERMFFLSAFAQPLKIFAEITQSYQQDWLEPIL